MKNRASTSALILSMLFIASLSKNVYADAMLSAFTIPDNFLFVSTSPTTFGKVFLNKSEDEMNFTATAVFTRSGSAYNDVRVWMVHVDLNGNSTSIGAQRTILASSFDNNIHVSALLSGHLPKGVTTGYVYVRYQLFEGSNTRSVQNSSVFYELPNNPSPHNGMTIRSTAPHDNGAIYIVMDGEARHIQSEDVWIGLFTRRVDQNIPSTNLPGMGIPISNRPITSQTQLIRDTRNGAIYFQELNVIRHITSPAVADKYKFKIGGRGNNVQNVPNINGFTVGAPFF